MSEESEAFAGELLPGSISSESLLQYEEQDEWYFSEGEADNEPDSSTVQEHEVEDNVHPREICVSKLRSCTCYYCYNFFVFVFIARKDGPTCARALASRRRLEVLLHQTLAISNR